ncbi:MAG: hypothetical protein ACFCU3_03400 [Verrucomicrobiales bacterium]
MSRRPFVVSLSSILANGLWLGGLAYLGLVALNPAWSADGRSFLLPIFGILIARQIPPWSPPKYGKAFILLLCGVVVLPALLLGWPWWNATLLALAAITGVGGFWLAGAWQAEGNSDLVSLKWARFSHTLCIISLHFVPVGSDLGPGYYMVTIFAVFGFVIFHAFSAANSQRRLRHGIAWALATLSWLMTWFGLLTAAA